MRKLRLGLAAAILAATSWAAAAEPAARIVSIGGAVTEILYALGAGDLVAAVDSSSLHPPEALRTKPQVGYMRQLSAEGILSSGPSLVVAVDGAGPPDTLKLIAEAGIRVARIPEDPTEAGVAQRIQAVAWAIGREEAGRALAERTAARFVSLAKARRRVERPIRALFVLSLQNGRAQVGGRNTTADGMFTLAGAENVAAGIEGYKPMTDEAIVAARPEVVVMLTMGPGGAPPRDLTATPALSLTPAARDGRLVTMDGSYLLGFGPRTPEAASELMRAFYPALAKE